MRLIAAFLKLIRLPNLFFILLTQALFEFCIYRSIYKQTVSEFDNIHFIFLLLASLFIAAAGYIINDYFDINIDEVNKPKQVVIDQIIHRRWAIAWHFMLSITGIIFTILALPTWNKWYLILINISCVVLLWFYSTSLKKKLLIGNILVSLFTAWSILIVFFSKVNLNDAFNNSQTNQHKFFQLAILYSGFAFIISLIREAIKDMEDMAGDAKYGCRTMPIVWGVNATKVYTGVWIVVLIGSLLVLQVYVLQFRWWWLVIYSIIFVISPLVYLLLQLKKSTSPTEFHRLSTIAKLIILTGICSMLFFYYYL